MGKAGGIDGDADAVALENHVLDTDRRRRVDAVLVARAACRLDREPHGHRARMLGELRREMPGGGWAQVNASPLRRRGDAQRCILRNLDHYVALAADRLACETRTGLERRGPVEHVPLVVARRAQALEASAHDDAAGRAAERAAAVVR